MSTDLVQILEGNTFVVSDNTGDIEASLTDPTGLLLLRHQVSVEVDPLGQRFETERGHGGRHCIL